MVLMPAPASVIDVDAPVELVPASRFTVEQLTAAYNQTRVDYLVPMPMNTARLAEYIRVYDVRINQSLVAVVAGEIVGLGMLGVRPGRAWLTRLGVLPGCRRRGIGSAISEALLENGRRLGAEQIILEVIKNNVPAYNLFIGYGFEVTRELVVLRRPPKPSAISPTGLVRWFNHLEALELLDTRAGGQSWITETASLRHADNLRGLALLLPDGASGWVVFQEQKLRIFPLSLARICLHTVQGDPLVVGRALLAHLYQQYPYLDTHTENIPADDPHLPAMFEMGYIEAFRRLEMRRPPLLRRA